MPIRLNVSGDGVPNSGKGQCSCQFVRLFRPEWRQWVCGCPVGRRRECEKVRLEVMCLVVVPSCPCGLCWLLCWNRELLVGSLVESRFIVVIVSLV